MRILIVDDEKDTQLFLKNRLQEKCFAVDIASDGEYGSYLAKVNDYDLIILDYNLPKKNGFTICREIREQENEEKRNTPILMISINGEMPHKVAGFSIGIDDYVSKPFFYDELFARIQAILRRPHVRQTNKIIINDLVIDTDAQIVTRGSDQIYLTRKEFALLEYLAMKKGQVVSRGSIAEHVWDMDVNLFSNTIEMHILNIRKKIERKGGEKLIYSIHGCGYKVGAQK